MRDDNKKILETIKEVVVKEINKTDETVSEQELVDLVKEIIKESK